MFENLSERLGSVFDRLTKQGALSEADVITALREVRVALLEADVSLPVAREFIKRVQDKATGAAVTKSITPGQMVVKIVHDELIHVLAGDGPADALKIDNPPATILMVGLQGSGKTTTTAKLAKRLKEKNGKKVLLASLDTNRPAAMEQLAILGGQIGVDSLPIVKGETAVQIAKRAKTQASLGGYDVLFLDTAGRLHIDEVLMDEVQSVRDIAQPRETLLVVDGLTGQDAVNVATEFDGKVGISGVVLTRMDGDGRGGAALSMRAVTGKPIRFVGLGEKMDAIETFEAEQAERMAKRFAKGLFNMNDLKMQLEQMMKMGGMQGLMGMMPGMGKMQAAAAEAGLDDKMLKRQIALIQSMTKKERANPDLLAASRKKRIASGAGLDVSDLNRLLKQHKQMAEMMKKMGKGGMMKQAMKAMMGKGGMPDPSKMTPEQLQEAAKGMSQGMGGMGGMGLPRGMTLPSGLSGLMKKR
jgi:signal recognition particle subunit SRP54